MMSNVEPQTNRMFRFERKSEMKKRWYLAVELAPQVRDGLNLFISEQCEYYEC